MKYKPDSLAEALSLCHDHPAYTLSFSETAESDNCIQLSGLPEIDFCFEDHGHYIFGLNLSLSSLFDYLEERDSRLALKLKPLIENCRPEALLGEIFRPTGIPEIILESLAGCKARLKTYDGTNGREIPISSWRNDSHGPVFQIDELPLLILFPKS